MDSPFRKLQIAARAVIEANLRFDKNSALSRRYMLRKGYYLNWLRCSVAPSHGVNFEDLVEMLKLHYGDGNP